MNDRTAERMAEEWVRCEFPEGAECCKVSFRAGYQAAEEKLRQQIQILEMQLRNANTSAMLLEAKMEARR